MSAVTIRPTFKKDSRPSNGLESITGKLIAKKDERHYVVGVVKWAGGNVDEDGQLVPAVKFLAIEPLSGDAAEQVAQILDQARKDRGLGIVNDIPAGGQLAGQAQFDFDDESGETRAGPDGEHVVPPPSGAEIVAELAERRAAKGKGKAAADPFTAGAAE